MPDDRTMRERIAFRYHRLTSGEGDWPSPASFAAADAILDELSEPTEAMIGACPYGHNSERVANWRAMIDTAKQERIDGRGA